MMEKKSWSKDEVFSLIKQWELSPELWDVRDKSYRNRIKKQNALKLLAMKFNTTENEISRKFHNLRTQYHQEIRRINSKKSGDEGDDICQSSWQFFDMMKFISNDNSNHLTVDNLKKSKEIDNKVEYLNISIDSADDENDRYDRQQEIMIKKFKKNETQESDDARHNTINQSSQDFQIFGDFVAAELKNIKSEEYQRQLKLAIQRAIIQFAELDATHCATKGVQTDLYNYPEPFLRECKIESATE